MNGPIKYRILTQDRKIKYAGTDHPSWFTLAEAKCRVDYTKGEKIIEHDGVNILWEVL